MKFSPISLLREFLVRLDDHHRESAAALTAVEARELENIFALLVLGSFIGLPAPPTFLAVELLPFMEREIRILNVRAEDAGDMLAEMCGMLGIDG
ncbi:MAG: hypothetical protein M0P04_04290 [Syntrophales bacterium]|jgi:hypothetical protein|nr:hypothetical protein [Syntrophales bacterium]MDD4339324.1 hypothetical protein [Syntrophales bacterium]HOG07407.1 hypothetical protein [Syntrophales bacterium]HOS76818.1 hypothetical protein [Syntrophales bacterium]HPB69487.1 hypothetical protein [Syntrophales bacterium]